MKRCPQTEAPMHKAHEISAANFLISAYNYESFAIQCLTIFIFAVLGCGCVIFSWRFSRLAGKNCLSYTLATFSFRKGGMVRVHGILVFLCP